MMRGVKGRAATGSRVAMETAEGKQGTRSSERKDGKSSSAVASRLGPFPELPHGLAPPLHRRIMVMHNVLSPPPLRKCFEMQFF